MGTLETALERLRRANEAIAEIDPEVAVEGREADTGATLAADDVNGQLEQESIVMRR